MKSLVERPKSFREAAQGPPISSFTDSEVTAVHAEVERILSSHHFFSSKRCQAFLRYAVAETLSGRQDLKERSIGVEVFDRTPSYDTNQDPVVRMTAGEVRKRLALYYQDSATDAGFRLDLPVGTYIPRFHFAAKGIVGPDLRVDPLESTLAADRLFNGEQLTPLTIEIPAIAIAGTVHPADEVQASTTRRLDFQRRLKLFGLAVAAFVTVCGAFTAWRLHRVSVVEKLPIEQFWEPYLTSTTPIFLSIGQIRPTRAEDQPNGSRSSVQKPIPLQGEEDAYPREIAVTVLGDSIAMTDIVALLRAGGKGTAIRAESATSFAELQRGPNILVGAFNNDWTIMFTDPLRFHFCLEDKAEWICDREHPEERLGLFVMGTRSANLKADYAIVGRFYNPASKQIVVIAAGITPYGTQAAGEFLTDPASIAELARHAPPNWSQKNMEVVIESNLIDNEVGPPIIVRSAFW